MLNEKVDGSRRKVTLDYGKGVISIALKGIDLGAWDKGTAPIPMMVEFDGIRLEDTPVMTVRKKSLRY